MDQKIVALQAKLKNQEIIIKDNILTFSKKLKDKLSSKRSLRGKQKGGKDPENKEEKIASKFRNGLQVFIGSEAWRSKALEDSAPRSIKKNDKDCHWCLNHKAWV